jgi:hypothetical protein
MIAKGIDAQTGTLRYNLAARALENERTAQFLQTQVLVSAIFKVGNAIIGALTKNPSSGPGQDSLSKLTTTLKDVLLPEQREHEDAKLLSVERRLQKELSRGKLKVTSLNVPKPRKNLRLASSKMRGGKR